MKKFYSDSLYFCLFAATATVAAAPLTPDLGGATTVAITGERAFRSIAANAEGMSQARFTFGQQLFNTFWEPAPGSQPTTDGLGPVFNRAACSDCHSNNGRGRPPAAGGEMESMLVRLSLAGTGTHGEPVGVPGYGDQLQDRAVETIPPEGKAVLSWTEVPGTYADGTAYSLRQPVLRFDELAFGALPDHTLTSARIASPLIGLGLLEAVPEATLNDLADPDDADKDGISGRMNKVWDAELQQTRTGRFGWKANQPSLRQQNAGAAIGDMGLTSPVFAAENCAPGQDKCAQLAAAVGHSPEIVPSFFVPLTRYTQLVAVPRQRNPDDSDVKAGAIVFTGIGCSGCHTLALQTGAHELAELTDQTIHPFTDLLLHDMGPGLADGRPDFLADGQEWRTAPLWGIGLTRQVASFEFYLHDGRARNLAEAILWHGGEAAPASQRFRALAKEQRAQLITFLESI